MKKFEEMTVSERITHINNLLKNGFFLCVWTPKYFGDFVAPLAAADGGHVIGERTSESDAVSLANRLNKGYSRGNYCVIANGYDDDKLELVISNHELTIRNTRLEITSNSLMQNYQQSINENTYFKKEVKRLEKLVDELRVLISDCAH